MTFSVSRLHLSVLVAFLAFGTKAVASDAPGEREEKQLSTLGNVTSTDVVAIESIEADIRSQDFNRRQRAMMTLWGNREAYRSWVEQATRDADAEVARRATWVLDRWRRGVLPDTPPEIAQRLEASSGPDTIESLMNVGLFNGALIALDEAIGGSASPAIVDRAKSAIKRRYPFYVRLAHQNDELQALVEIMDRLSDDASMILAHQQLNQALTQSTSIALPSSATRWTTDERKRFDVILHTSLGKLDRGIELAKQTGDVELIRVCRMLRGDWATMADEHLAAANSAEPDSLEWYRQWMYALIASSRADKESIREQAIAALAQPRVDEKDFDDADPINRIRWQTLALHGELDAAVAILEPMQAEDAAELLSQSSRYADAFEVLGVDWHDLDSQIALLVENAIASQRSEVNVAMERSTPELTTLLSAVRLLVSTGRQDLALSSLKTLVDHPSLSNQEVYGNLRIEVIRAVARMNRDAWIGKLVVGKDDTTLPARMQFFLSMALDTEAETIGALLEAIEKLNPGQRFYDRVGDMVTMLRGELPSWFNAETDFYRLFDLLSQNRRVVRGRGTVSIVNMPRLNVDFVRMFELHGYPMLAKQSLTVMAEAGDVGATLSLAEAELNEGSVATARSLFEKVWSDIDTQGQNAARINQSEADALTAMKAIYGEAIAARRLGDVDGFNELEQLIQWMSFSPSTSLRNSFAEYLVEQGHSDKAEAIYESLMRLTAFGSDDNVEFYTVARNYDSAVAQTKPAAAAAAFDLAISGTIETTVFYPAAYVSLPTFVHRRTVTNAIARNDVDAAHAATNKLLRLDPIDIDFGEKVIKTMREAGMEELATETLERIYQAGAKHLTDFPLDIGTCNNLAWVLALSDHRLDEALNYSKRAVFYEPESTIYRDTLAEVLFRQGRKAEAIAIEKACLMDDPSEWHVHEQIRRFEGKSPVKE